MGINSIYYEMNSLMSGSEEREGVKKEDFKIVTKKNMTNHSTRKAPIKKLKH